MSSILDRMRLSWGVLRGIKSAYEAIPTWVSGKPQYPLLNYENVVRFGFRINPIVYACIMLKADSASSAPIIVRKMDGEELPTHPLQSLLNNPNPYMSAFDFSALTLITLDMAGRCYWEKVRSGARQVVQLWPLRPDCVKVVPGSKDFIEAYEYQVPGMDKVIIDPKDVLDFKLWDPLDYYNGLPPMMAALRSAAVDNGMTDYLKEFFEHGGMPIGLISSKLKLQDDDVDRLRGAWRKRYGGKKNWQDPAILDMDATYQKMGLTFKEMGFDTLDSRSEARICMALRVPPILIGAKVGLDRSTYSNYGEARKSFWQETLIPQYRRIQSELMSDLVPEFGGDIEIGYDFSQTPALQEDLSGLWTRANTALTGGGITVNEYRALLGYPEVDAGNVFLRSPLLSSIPSDAASWEDEGGDSEAFDEGEEGEEMARRIQAAKRLLIPAGEAPDAADRRRIEKMMQKDLEKYFRGQLRRMNSALDLKVGSNGGMERKDEDVQVHIHLPPEMRMEVKQEMMPGPVIVNVEPTPVNVNVSPTPVEIRNETTVTPAPPTPIEVSAPPAQVTVEAPTYDEEVEVVERDDFGRIETVRRSRTRN